MVHSHPDSESAKCFIGIAKKLTEETAKRVEKGEDKKIPLKFGPVGQSQVEIEWNDGVKTSYSARELRYLCPCASCVNEVTGERSIKLEWVPQNMTAQAFYPVGRYAVQIVWSDGHNTGLYGFENLRVIARSVATKQSDG